jgi:hypothetical protein
LHDQVWNLRGIKTGQKKSYFVFVTKTLSLTGGILGGSLFFWDISTLEDEATVSYRNVEHLSPTHAVAHPRMPET